MFMNPVEMSWKGWSEEEGDKGAGLDPEEGPSGLGGRDLDTVEADE